MASAQGECSPLPTGAASILTLKTRLVHFLSHTYAETFSSLAPHKHIGLTLLYPAHLSLLDFIFHLFVHLLCYRACVGSLGEITLALEPALMESLVEWVAPRHLIFNIPQMNSPHTCSCSQSAPHHSQWPCACSPQLVKPDSAGVIFESLPLTHPKSCGVYLLHTT